MPCPKLSEGIANTSHAPIYLILFVNFVIKLTNGTGKPRNEREMNSQMDRLNIKWNSLKDSLCSK